MTNQTASGNPGSVGMNTMLNQLLNAGQLLFDRRVPLTLKLLLPVAALVYWISPVDLMPFLPFDDIAVVAAAIFFFTQFGNQAVKDYDRRQGPAGQSGDAQQPEGEVVDTTWRVIE
jgi:uncharacterized membrane protein YkvA (DUF1232 family)